jgi:hypothetical protein
MRSTRYFKGIGKGKCRPGTVVFDKDGKIAFEIEKVPGLDARLKIEGEPVICSANGEVLDLDVNGPTRVENANEKMAYLKKTGNMPSPEGLTAPREAHYSKAKSFRQHFFEEHGMSVNDYVRSKYGENAELNWEM